MGDTVQVALIIAVALIIVLLLFRRQLSNFQFKGGKDGLELQLKTRKEDKPAATSQPNRKSSGVSVSGNKLWGRKNKINVQAGSKNVSADNNQLLGDDQEITVKPESKQK